MSAKRQVLDDDPALDRFGSVEGGIGSGDVPSGGGLPVAGEFAGRERVAGIQRARILTGLVEVVGERGVGNVRVAHIVARSGVSRRTFYELFDDREDCVLAAFDETLGRIAAVVLPAYEEPSRWLEKMRAGLTALLEFLDDQRDAGRLVIVDALGAGANALERRRRVLVEVIAAVGDGAAEVKGGDGPSPVAAEGVVGGVLAVLHSRLLASPRSPAGGGSVVGAPAISPLGEDGSLLSEDGSLLELAVPLMSMIVLPYLGPAAARRELKHPVPQRHVRQSHALSNPLRDLDMRLTYRTVRVLTAVAELGGQGSYPSNREIGIASGVGDQGQISKLLTRLSKLGLIENGGAGLARGAPNAWVLTSKGAEVERAIGQDTG